MKFILILMLCGTLNCLAQDFSPVEYVDPFIGTQADGNTFPGAALPFGMVKLGPDCGDLNSNSGYYHDSGVKGFSHTHVSGTGGGCKYGNILVAPFISNFPSFDCRLESVGKCAVPGYFSMDFDNGIKAEMTVSRHAAIHRYSFGENGNSGIMIEAGSLLGRFYDYGEAQNLIGSEVEILSPTEISGFSRQDGGWNIGGPYTVYFYAMFDCPSLSSGVLIEGESPQAGRESAIGNGKSVAGYFIFDSCMVEVRVGISYISIAKAKENCLHEVGEKEFETVRRNAKNEWDSYLGRMRIYTDDKEEYVKFYTALYHTMLQPTDKTGENALWHSELPYYDDFYCLWDTFRTNHPLYTLILPERVGAIVNSLSDIYRHVGYMPDGRSGDSNGRTQGGSNGDMVVAEAIIKGIEGIDYSLAVEAMLKDAEADPGSAARRHGRGGLEDYKRLGYVSTDYERSGVRTLEYSANDYAIALALEKLGKLELANKYFDRSSNWENLWKDVTYDGITGFIMPRKQSGDWDEEYRNPTWDYYVKTPEYKLGIDPYNRIPLSDRDSSHFTAWTGGSWVNIFYESNSWEYSLYAPHAMSRLIEKCGGKQKFVERLDHFFDNGHYNINNEPGFLTPCLYIYAGRHDKTMEKIDNILTRNFSGGAAGLPGNDDSGAISSWFVFHNIGLFPVAGQDVYLLTAPRFRRIELNHPSGNPIVIEGKNLNPGNIYVKSVKIDGKAWHNPWIRHEDLVKGANIEFVMDSKPSSWFEGELPPSK